MRELENDVSTLRSFQSPFTVSKLGVLATTVVISRAFNLTTRKLVEVKLAVSFTVQFVTTISTIILSITEILGVDTLAIAAMFGSNRTGLDLAHERQKLLTGCQLPFLSLIPDDGANTPSLVRVRLLHGPVPVELRDLVASVSSQCVRLEIIVGLVTKPVSR